MQLFIESKGGLVPTDYLTAKRRILNKQKAQLLSEIPHIDELNRVWRELGGTLDRLDEFMPKVYEWFESHPDSGVTEDEVDAFYVLGRNRQDRERIRDALRQHRGRLVEEAKAKMASMPSTEPDEEEGVKHG